jgi:nucleoside-diphosphate-sugar epimerase
MTKILVTGGSGFIGKHLIKKIRSSQHEVIGVNSLAGDVADKNTWSNFEPADVLVHLASNTFVPDSWKDPNTFLQTNFHGTVCALDYCRQHDAKLVYLSSYLYGNPSMLPIPESAPLVAMNPYALSKKLAEEVCKFYADIYGVKIIILRPFNVYGSGQSDRFLIPSLINQVRSKNTISVQDLEPRRDFIYIDDLVDAIIKAMEIQLDFDIFNIGSGVSYSVAELIEIIQKIHGTSAGVKVDGERRIGEVMDTQADITKAFDVLGWSPKYSLHSGLEKMLVTAS